MSWFEYKAGIVSQHALHKFVKESAFSDFQWPFNSLIYKAIIRFSVEICGLAAVLPLDYSRQ